MTYLHPEEFQAKTFEVRCRPTATGDGFEIHLTRGKRLTNHYRKTVSEAVSCVAQSMIDFYLGTKTELERVTIPLLEDDVGSCPGECDRSTDPDIADSCPECEDRQFEEKVKK